MGKGEMKSIKENSYKTRGGLDSLGKDKQKISKRKSEVIK